jgi:uncharacterized integral membrane protein
MLRKIVSALVLIPLALVIVALAVANKGDVTVSFDPFGAVDPGLAFRAPLYALLLLLLIAGVIVGGVATWLGQRKWRRAARRLERELAAERRETDRLREKIAADEAAPRPLSLRPPAA